VTSAIRKHLGDFLAVIALMVLGIGVAAYILANERLRFPLIEEKPLSIKVELPDAQAVQPGQGQTVRVAGVEVGQIGKVELEDGKAVVELQIEPKYKGLVRNDATALLRTKTGLKDMFVEVDPGDGKPLGSGATIPVENSAPDIDPDEFLAALDSDTRDYLKLLINGAGTGLKGRHNDLRETFARLGPVHRDLARFTSAVAARRQNLRRLIHNYGLLVEELGTKDNDLTRLVGASNAVLSALAAEDTNVSSFVHQLPGSLRTTQSTLVKVNRLSRRLRPALNALRPPFRQLDTANRAVLPFVREATPILKNRIRPFARSAQPFTRDLGQASNEISDAGPDLTKSFHKLNRFFNLGAYNPGGAEGLTGDLAKDRARNEGYLYWLGWVTQNTVALFNTADAQGPFRRFTAGGVQCNTFSQIAAGAGVDVSSDPLPTPITLPDNLPPPLDGLSGMSVTDPNTLEQFLGDLGLCAP
jgi:phospholipid/cholesterol/gamma-HCH transport system substrate-binding protein